MSDDYLKLQLLSRLHPRTSFNGVLKENTRPQKIDSPYYPDRESSRAHRVKGSEQESEWRDVPISREQEAEKIARGEIDALALSEQSLRKILII